ncbi:hypothetical protein [Dactylosporangium sp. CA-233914]|uniref:hypothetical protein n=1 Tax=Dactylosporangium sp. CA-233914 TaxID=3239934 RepID=UPI003D8D9BAC
MPWKRDFEGLDALVAERGNALLATAVLLTGGPGGRRGPLKGRLDQGDWTTTVELSEHGLPVTVPA